MKALVLCAYILAFTSFSSALVKQQVKNAIRFQDHRNDRETCMEEHNMNLEDWYTEEEISLNRHTDVENEERSRKQGCVAACSLKKKGLMDDTGFDEANIVSMINEDIPDPLTRIIARRILLDCINEVKDVIPNCEKALGLYACVMKRIHVLQEHDEHEVEVNRNVNTQSNENADN